MTDFSLDRFWDSPDAAARLVRAALTPASWLYGAAVAARNAGYDRGWFESAALGLPTIAVGNLTVGGTGKTPVAAWLVERAIAHGARPAVLLRGYGGDEVEVHRTLNPGVLVVPDANRVRGARAALAAGVTGFVLDDAFQHRRVRRDADLVLLSADRHGAVRLLPAGRWREPILSLRRATHVVVTRKRASAVHALEVAAFVRQVAPEADTVQVLLSPDSLVKWGTGERKPLGDIAGADVVAVSGIADPAGFERQLREAGARITPRRFRDHHAFSPSDVARLARAADASGSLVCTLKDAVKLGPLWPPSAPPIWYLSLRVRVEQGAAVLDDLARRLSARGATS